MGKECKVNKHNSTVCGYPGRDFDWTKFCWDGRAYNFSLKMFSPAVYVDNGFIAPNCEYLHVPYDWTENGTVFRVRPNESMYAGEIYRGHLIKSVKAIKKEDGWYWVLDLLTSGAKKEV